MRSVGVRELKDRTSAIIRDVREHGESVDVTYRGRVVARLIPADVAAAKLRPAERAKLDAFWQRWDALAAEIGAGLPDDVSAVDIVKDGRRDF